jgi:hypothetical protein
MCRRPYGTREASGGPQLCGQARGVAGVDYSTKRGPPNFVDKFDNPNPYDKCWYAMSKFRPLYPEYINLSDYELIQKLYAVPNPWKTLGMWASIAWHSAGGAAAFSGFAAKRP